MKGEKNPFGIGNEVLRVANAVFKTTCTVVFKLHVESKATPRCSAIKKYCSGLSVLVQSLWSGGFATSL